MQSTDQPGLCLQTPYNDVVLRALSTTGRLFFNAAKYQRRMWRRCDVRMFRRCLNNKIWVQKKFLRDFGQFHGPKWRPYDFGVTFPGSSKIRRRHFFVLLNLDIAL